MKISLDQEALLLLSSETRMEILRSIADRRKTLSELSKEIGISKSSVKDHLEKLEKAGLIRRVDEGRKWIYYEITKEGAKIVRPEPERRVIVKFVASIAMFVSGLVMLAIYYMASLKSRVQMAPSAVRETPVPAKEIEKAVITPTPAPTPVPIATPTHTPTPVTTPAPAQTPVVEVAKKGVEFFSPDLLFYISLVLITAAFLLLLMHMRNRS